jgi:hypothetical protein
MVVTPANAVLLPMPSGGTKRPSARWQFQPVPYPVRRHHPDLTGDVKAAAALCHSTPRGAPSAVDRGTERLLIGTDSGRKTKSGRNMPLPVKPLLEV